MAGQGDGSKGEAQPMATRRGWLASELGARVASALVLAIVALLATYEGGRLFALFWLVAGLAVLLEWTAMTRVEPAVPLRAVLGLGLVTLTGVEVFGGPALLALGLGAAAVLAAVAVASSPRDRIWAVGGFASAAIVVVVPPLVREHPELGLVGLLWMFAVVWVTDVAAYFTGRRLGGPKLWARVSPKKTWSGFLGGLLLGTLAGICVAVLSVRQGWAPVAPLWLVAVISALGSVVSQLGDLAESALKRRCQVKDSSHLIPGHGGAMDRLDGFFALCAFVGLTLVGVRLAGRW